MGAPLNPDRISESEYLTLDRESDIRHEYIDGRVYAMSGASREHIAIVSSLNYLLYGALRGGPCSVFMVDMRVRTGVSAADKTYTYPDVTVTCGEGQYDDDAEAATLLNPTLIIEVLSASTEAYDRGRKFHDYQKLASLQDYVLVAQEKPRVECFSRGDGFKWILDMAEGLDTAIHLPSLDLSLSLTEVYEQVEL